MKNMNLYKYRPVRFYGIVFALTWGFWFAAAIVSRLLHAGESAAMTLMLLGLLVPSVTAITIVLTSKNAALKSDLKHKLVGLFRIRPLIVLTSVGSFFAIIALSILLSTAVGQSLSQFSFVAGFSFSIGGVPTLLTLVLTALLEELGWRGYAEDSIANYCSWFRESVIFGIVWAMWHLPLFVIPGTYQAEILEQSPLFLLNFLISIMPLGFLFTWVYVKNGRSIFACMIFHFFVNLLQEEVAMTQVTKCVETAVLFAAAAVIVLTNRGMFFEKRHIGKLIGL